MLNHSPVVQHHPSYNFVLAENGTVTPATIKGIKHHVFANGRFGGKDTDDGSLREVAVFEFGTQTTKSVCEPETRIKVEVMD